MKVSALLAISTTFVVAAPALTQEQPTVQVANHTQSLVPRYDYAKTFDLPWKKFNKNLGVAQRFYFEGTQVRSMGYPGYCIDGWDAAPANGKAAKMWACDTSKTWPQQQWKLSSTKPWTYARLELLSSWKCLDVPEANPNKDLQYWDCGVGNDNQLFNYATQWDWDNMMP